MEKDLSSGLVVKEKPSAVQEKQRGEKTEFQCDTKELEGMHQRKVFEMKSRQVHKDELREPPVSQETANGDSYIRKESEPPRKEETKPLPRTVPSQHPINQPQKGGHLSQEHPQSWEVRETKTKDDPSCSQTLQKRLLQGHSHAQSETRDVSALKEPAAQPAPPATWHPRGEREDVDTSSGDSEEDDVVFVSSEPGSPLLFDLTPDSQKKENLKFPGQSEQRKISPASGVCKKGEPLDPAAQRVHLTAQLKQKKVTPDLCFYYKVGTLFVADR